MVNPALNASERQWLAVREFLREHRHELTTAAAGEYPPADRVAGTPLLARPEWLPDVPVPLRGVRMVFRPSAGRLEAHRAAQAVPEGYSSYAQAMRALAPPAVFEDRGTYRLLDGDLRAADAGLAFGRGHYFDGINVGEAAAHEFAAARFPGGGGAGAGLRVVVGDPCDLRRRPVNLAISTLTVRLNRRTGQATFLLHWRDPALVGHAAGMHQVVPVGVFQPSQGVAGDEVSVPKCW